MGLGSVLGAAIGALTDNEDLGDFIGGATEAAGDCIDAVGDCIDAVADFQAQAAYAPILAQLPDRNSQSNSRSAFRRIKNDVDDDDVAMDGIPKNAASKPRMLNFGDALASGLPESWSIVPPDSGVIQRRKPQ